MKTNKYKFDFEYFEFQTFKKQKQRCQGKKLNAQI